MREVRIALNGAAGRMGRELQVAADQTPNTPVVAAVVASSDEAAALGHDRVVLAGELPTALAGADVVVDFTAPAGFRAALAAALGVGCAFVSGTTGLSEADHAALEEAAQRIPVLWAANFSPGVNALEHLVELASRALDSFDIEVFEAHHRDKVDAPSGTALFLGRAAARGRGVALDEVARMSREGLTGRRTREEIGFGVLRGGSIVGEHTVFLCGAGERIELTHRAQERAIFARGAIRAARWLVERPAGSYTMRDVLFG